MEPGQALQAAQAAIRRGERRQARALLTQAARDNPNDFRVWLLLASIAGSPRASLDYIARAERLQPGHPTIARARTWAEGQLAGMQRAAAESTRVPTQTSVPSLPRSAFVPVPEVGPSSRPRRWAGAVAATILLLVVVLAAGWAWNGRGPRTPSITALANTVPTMVPAVTSAGPSADTVIRGAFLPVSVAILPDPVATATPLAIAAQRKVSHAAGPPRATWTVTPSPTPTLTPTPTLVPTFVSDANAPQPALVLRPPGVGPDERWIDVNLTQQRLVAYEGDTPVFETLVSSGTWNHPTVTGQFRVWLRYTSQTMDGRRLGYNYYLENVPFVMYFYNDYALHGTYWHNNFGTPMSHGCVNLPTPAAEWIFNWSALGTVVNVHY